MAGKNKNKRIVKNTIFLYFRMLFILFLSFFTTRVLLEKIGVEDYGLYTVVAGFVMMFGFINTSMSNSIQRFINFEMGKNNLESTRKVFLSSLSVQLILGAIIFTLLEIIGSWYINNKLSVGPEMVFAANILFQATCISLVLNIIKAPYNAALIANEKMDLYAFLSILDALLKLFIIYAIPYIPTERLVAYSILFLGTNILILLFTTYYVYKNVSYLKGLPIYNKALVKEMISFSGWNLFGTASGVIKSQGINVLINAFFSLTVNASRGVAYQIHSGINQLTHSFQVALNPQIVQSYSEGNMPRYLNLSYMSSKVSIFLMWMITLPILLCTDDILSIWLGNNIPQYTSLFTKIVVCTGMTDTLGAAISVPLYATGKIKYYQIIVSLITISILPLSYIFYRMGFPPETSMYISLALSIIAQIARVIIWTRLINEPIINYIKKIVIPTIIIASISLIPPTIAPHLLKGTLHITSIIYSTLYSIIINTILVFTIGINATERKTIYKLIKK